MKLIRLAGRHQALSAFDWTDIPPFAVIAGLNGVGKTQLLELLGGEWSAAALFSRGPELKLEPRPSSIGYLPAFWQLGDEKVTQDLFKPVAELAQVIEAKLGQSHDLDAILAVLFNSFKIGADAQLGPLAKRVVAGLSRRGRLQIPISHTDILGELCTYDLVKRDSSEPLGTLAEIFYAYANARVTLALTGVPAEQWGARLGSPPWDEANRLLRFFETRFQLTSPGDVRSAYELRCHLQEDRVTIKPSALSSGEQAVLALVAVMVTTSVLGARDATAGGQAPTVEPQVAVVSESGTTDGTGESYENGADNGNDEPAAPVQEPRQESQLELLLLDEPDAHLHTSMVKRYLEHLGQLTKQGVQIIMVTHRPDTIALAPAGSLFEMRREGDRTSIVKVTSKAELIGRLAADTISVLPGVRVVLVEDEDDREFHQLAYERVRELGILLGPPRLVFMPVLAKDPNRPRVGEGSTP